MGNYYKDALQVCKDAIEQAKHNSYTKKAVLDHGGNIKETLDLFKKFQENLKQSHVFKISKELSMMLTLTDNKDFDNENLKLPYEFVFLDFKITLEPYDLRGIILENIWENNRENVKDIFVGYIFGKRHIPDGEGGSHNEVELVTRNFSSLDNKEDEYYELNQDVKNLIMNFLDFLNNPDIEFTKKDYKENEMGTFEKKYSAGCSDIVVYGKLKVYLDNLKKTMEENPHLLRKSCWVRGHWRRFYSEKFINKKGLKTWIYPFIRGHGEPEKKEYELR